MAQMFSFPLAPMRRADPGWGEAYEGRSQKTREEATVLVQVSDDGSWTKVGAKGVEISRHTVDLSPHLPYLPAPKL